MNCTITTFLTTQTDPIQTTLDTTLQYILRDHLAKQIKRFQALNGSGLILNIRNGEILALVSLPDFDPNQLEFDLKEQPFFNHITQGRYEMGSVFKIFNTALAFESEHITGAEQFNVRDPIERAGFTPIKDFSRAKKEFYTIPEIFYLFF